MEIYLVHGLSAPHWIMKPLAKKLSNLGHTCHLLNYPSRRMNASQAAEHIWHKLRPKLKTDKPIAIVTHSLGGIVVQHMLDRYRPKGINGLIMIAPPNHGSELFTLFNRSIFTRWILYVIGALPHHDLSYKNTPIAPNVCQSYPCHLINGITRHTLSGRFIPRANDGIVSVKSTKIEHLLNIKTLPYEHMILIFCNKTANFLHHCLTEKQ